MDTSGICKRKLFLGILIPQITNPYLEDMIAALKKCPNHITKAPIIQISIKYFFG